MKDNLVGKKFGRWEVVEYRGINQLHKSTWLCRCSCGTEKVVVEGNLKSGVSKSCGCATKEAMKNNTFSKKHGKSLTRPYRLWSKMMSRCYKKYDREYMSYGGRGISVCKRWHDFVNFYADMGDRPNDKTLDRIDNSKGYSPDNCRWATIKQQNNNRRNNTIIEYLGRKMTLQQWADLTNIKAGTISNRIKNLKWSIKDSLTKPVEIHHKKR